MRSALCVVVLLAACDKQKPRVAERTPQPVQGAGVVDAKVTPPAPLDAAVDADVEGRRPPGNTGTCAMLVPVAPAQARHEAVKGSKRGAAGCPTQILHGVVFAPGDTPQPGQIQLSDEMTRERKQAHDPAFCVYTLTMGCP